MITEEQRREDEAAYAAAFGEEMAPTTTEDDSFGLDPKEEIAASADGAAADNAADAPAGDSETLAVAVVDEGEIDRAAEQKVADATTTTADEEQDQPTDPKEIQRQKSWEGRLRAREEELARREAELKAMMEGKGKTSAEAGDGAPNEDAMQQAAEQLEAEGNTEGAEAVEEVAERVESGELTPQQAMEILAEDFGPEFVKMIQVIAVSQAEGAAKNAIGKVERSVDGLIASITDDRARSHFETIADAHPDFNDLASSPEFAEFAKNYPDGDRITQAGTAREIVKMLNKYKEGLKPAQNEPDPALDAAEGVRSAGLRLPETPVKADGYEDAWSQF